VAVLVADTRFVLPVLFALTLASIVAGPTLLAWPRRRKRLSPAAPAATDLEEGGS
jgi:hypothetical protein